MRWKRAEVKPDVRQDDAGTGGLIGGRWFAVATPVGNSQREKKKEDVNFVSMCGSRVTVASHTSVWASDSVWQPPPPCPPRLLPPSCKQSRTTPWAAQVCVSTVCPQQTTASSGLIILPSLLCPHIFHDAQHILLSGVSRCAIQESGNTIHPSLNTPNKAEGKQTQTCLQETAILCKKYKRKLRVWLFFFIFFEQWVKWCLFVSPSYVTHEWKTAGKVVKPQAEATVVDMFISREFRKFSAAQFSKFSWTLLKQANKTK